MDDLASAPEASSARSCSLKPGSLERTAIRLSQSRPDLTPHSTLLISLVWSWRR
jgi:hypothetical protein